MPSVSVPIGDTAITIAGTFGPAASYEVFVQPRWATMAAVTQADNSVLVEFTVAAPPDATLVYLVVGASAPGPPGPGVSTLASYLADVRRFLRARTGDQLYDDSDLIPFINRAMQQRDLDLGLNRSLVSFPMVTGQVRYPVASILAGGVVLDGHPNPNVIDMLSIVYTPLGTTQPGGGIRVPLGRWPYSKLAYLLSVSYPTLPRWYAMFGTQTVVIGPPPAGNYPTEYDFFGYASPLVNPLDADPLGYPWTDPVPFMAASLAKAQAQRYDEAKEWETLYAARLNRVRARGRPLAVANPFADLPRR